METTLSVHQLSLSFKTESGNDLKAVRNLSFTIEKGQTLALVGESGSGKSLTAHAIMGLLPRGCETTQGEITLGEEKISDFTWEQMTAIRGKKIGYIFQDPMASLNPTLPIGKQIEEPLILHTTLPKSQRKQRIIELLELVEIPSPESRIDDFPHQFSGGQRQRIMIAIAIACNPKILIADEPTTALDVTVQTQILSLLKKLQKRTGVSLLFISHDLSLVSSIADKVCVMYAGELVETADISSFLSAPLHPYSRALTRAIPTTTPPLAIPEPIAGKLPSLQKISKNTNCCQFAARCPMAMQGCLKAHPEPYSTIHLKQKEGFVRCFLYHPDAPTSPMQAGAQIQKRKKKISEEETPVILEAKDLHLTYSKEPTLSKIFSTDKSEEKGLAALKSVSIKLYKAKTLGLVGESGSGKSSLAKCLTQIIAPSSGEVLLDGVSCLKNPDPLHYSKKVQMVFQDPYSSLNPRMTLFQILNEPLELHNICSKRVRFTRITELLQYVGLPSNSMDCYPHQFSGGQRQRIGIARALAVEPEVLIADEPVSSLDVSIQAQIIQLLLDLQEKFSLSYLFIGHDLALIRLISDHIAVMHQGEIVEYGCSEQLFENPQHDYTKKLISSIPKNHFAASI